MSKEHVSVLNLPSFAIIPYPVLSDNQLEPAAKLFYGCLTTLSEKEGYCWATNEQLAHQQQVSERQIMRWLDCLEERGHINRSIENNTYRNEDGRLLWKKQRKIYTHQGFSKKVFEGDKNVTIDEGDKNVTLISKSLTSKSLKEKHIAPKPQKQASPETATSLPTEASLPCVLEEKKKPPKQKIQRRQFVNTSDEEHGKLEVLCHQHGITVDECYDLYNQWKENAPMKKWGKSDYLSIRNWTIQAVSDRKTKQKHKTKQGDISCHNLEHQNGIKSVFSAKTSSEPLLLKSRKTLADLLKE